MATRTFVALAATAVMLGLTACSSTGGANSDAPKARTAESSDGFSLFGGAKNDGKQISIGVNAFLWRASLDTLSFMPLASADPWGGVINTDWYANPEKPDERFKVTVFILDTRLRADGVTVSVFKEIQQNGGWVTAAVDPDTGIAIENSILTRARQLRLASLDN